MKTRIFDATRRSFLVSSVRFSTIFQLQGAARAFGLVPEANVCRLSAEQEEGPFYVADELFRSDIAEHKPGLPLSLRIVVLDARTCRPLANAAVDLWHCDALGVYSGFTKENPMRPGGFGGPGGPPMGGPPPKFDPQQPGDAPGPPEDMGPPHQNRPRDKLTFLRGIQLTAADGSVRFNTVFPGFYMGRTNHIHFKVRVGGQENARSYEAGHTSHTGQIFFPEAVTIELMQHEPYSLHTIQRTTQGEDQVFADQQGGLSLARFQSLGPGTHAEGMHADLVASVDPTATPPRARRRGGPGAPSAYKP